MNTNHELLEMRVIFSNGTNKYTQFGGGFSPVNGWELKQVGTFRSDYEEKYFANADEFKAAIKKYLTNPRARIVTLYSNKEPMYFKFYDEISQDVANNTLLFLLNKVN
jgi:hypothetical protein